MSYRYRSYERDRDYHKRMDRSWGFRPSGDNRYSPDRYRPDPFFGESRRDYGRRGGPGDSAHRDGLSTGIITPQDVEAEQLRMDQLERGNSVVVSTEDGKFLYTCELCSAQFNTTKNLQLHTSGMKHLKRKNVAIKTNSMDKFLGESSARRDRAGPSNETYGAGSDSGPNGGKRESQDENFLRHLSGCKIRDDEDAALAIRVVKALITGLKDYNEEMHEKNFVSLLGDAEKLMSSLASVHSSKHQPPLGPGPAAGFGNLGPHPPPSVSGLQLGTMGPIWF